MKLFLLFLVLESPLAMVAQQPEQAAAAAVLAEKTPTETFVQMLSTAMHNLADTNNSTLVYGQPGFPGFTSGIVDVTTHATELKYIFAYSVLLILPISFFLFYHQVLDSYIGDVRLQHQCLHSPITHAGFETKHVVIPVGADLPEVTSFLKYIVVMPQEAPTKGALSLVPAGMLNEEERAGASWAFAVADIQNTDDIQNGDIIVAVDCEPIHVTAGQTPLTSLQKKIEDDSHYFKGNFRVPLYLTLLRPVSSVCPPFMYNPLGQTYCCDKADDECFDPTDQTPQISKQRFIEATSSRVLSDLLLERSRKLRGKKATDPRKTSDSFPLTTGTPFRTTGGGFRTSKPYATIKHLLVALTVISLTFTFLYIPFHYPDNLDLRRNYEIVFLVVTGITVCSWLVGGYVTAIGKMENKKNVFFYVTSIGVWLMAVLVPGVTFISHRALDTNKDQRITMQFSMLTSFIGLMFSALYFMHNVIVIVKERLGLPAPEILSNHLGELVLGTASFLDALAGFRDLSRTLYSNGGACQVSDLSSQLHGLRRGGEPVKWICDTDEQDRLDVPIAQGKSCMVNCGGGVVKPVLCHDYGVTGGAWSITEQNTTRFCCHPFVCGPTETYCSDRCGLEDTGCRPKSQGC